MEIFKNLLFIINPEPSHFKTLNFGLGKVGILHHWPNLRNIQIMDNPLRMCHYTLINIKWTELELLLLGRFRPRLLLDTSKGLARNSPTILCNHSATTLAIMMALALGCQNGTYALNSPRHWVAFRFSNWEETSREGNNCLSITGGFV